MNVVLPAPTKSSDKPLEKSEQKRFWQARLELAFARRESRTALTLNKHDGPLRVQRPFYPENNGCCHVYLLHPPGGMVVGDELCIRAHLQPSSHSLITTPSAGRFYRVGGSSTEQVQDTHCVVAQGGLLEWLPQETILFNDANAHIKTKFELQATANLIAWDIICLGRPAAQEAFEQGRCKQTLELWRDGRLVLNERVRLSAGEAMHSSAWGLQGMHAFGTMVVTVKCSRAQVDTMVETLDSFSADPSTNRWGVTQKEDILLVRYLGNDTLVCKKGFEWVWGTVRPQVSGLAAVAPRIWRT